MQNDLYNAEPEFQRVGGAVLLGGGSALFQNVTFIGNKAVKSPSLGWASSNICFIQLQDI